ncbi:MAG: DUF465 domain-containing protein [Proteobacteria bacterium]|nr:DUF465 domain-containing protein [Burkholderiales bacterium]
MTMSDPYHTQLQARIEALASEHRDLERLIGQLVETPVPDTLRLRRLKKRKLLVKDQLTALQRELAPDVRA